MRTEYEANIAVATYASRAVYPLTRPVRIPVGAVILAAGLALSLVIAACVVARIALHLVC